MNPDQQDQQREFIQLKKDIQELTEAFYSNNFSASQDFNKYSRFNTRLKVPHYDTLPSVCEVGEIAESGGKLRICSSANTWTVVGAQTA